MYTFDKANLKTLRNEIDAALKALGERHGLKIHAGSARFTSGSAEFKVEFAAIAEGGVVLTPERQNWGVYAGMYDLKPEWLDKSFGWSGKTFKITGLNPKKHKRPVTCSGNDGKGYVFPAEDVKRLMSR